MTREKYRARLIKRQAMLEKERRAATELLIKARDDVDSVNIALHNCVQDLIKFDRETLATIESESSKGNDNADNQRSQPEELRWTQSPKMS